MPKKPKRKVKNGRKQKLAYNRPDNNNHDSHDTSDSDADIDDVIIEVLDAPTKSEQDVNEYRVIKLPNGIVVLLVALPGGASGDNDISNGSASCNSDEFNPNAECAKCESHSAGWLEKMMQAITRKAFIYLTIGAGCFSDPRQVPGVSSFVGGTILHNSKKYPYEEDDFSLFVVNCGGEEHRGIYADTTTFTINVPETHFVETLDRLANGFSNPLIERKQTNSVRQYFEAAYVLRAQSREFLEESGNRHLFANLASARHPAKAFGPHNLKGLFGIPDDQVYKEVVKYRERHYSAHRMTLVLKAKLSLETLEMFAKKYLSKIPNNNLPPRDLSQYNFANSFDTSKSRKFYTMKPTSKRESYAIELFWSLPPSHWLYRSKPHDYIAAMLQHEGKGSLVAYLRMKNWCTKIVIGETGSDFVENSMYCLFSIKISLTELGHNNRRKILDAVFSYINMLRRAGPQERIFDELRKIEDFKFRFEQNFETPESLKDVCMNMQNYPPIDYLTGKYLYLEYDDVALKTCIELLTPERATIVVHDKHFKKSETEEMSFEESVFACLEGVLDCDTQPKAYSSTDIPEDWINHWKNVEPMSCFDLPKPNSYLPDDFTLIPSIKDPPRYPVKIHADALSEVWYKPDSKFRLPHCCIHFHYVTPLPLAEPENAAMLDMFVETLKQVMIEELYPAVFAGLKYEIKTSEKGLVVQAHGFNKKLPHVMQTISKYIAKCSRLVDADFFQRIKLYQEESYRESLRDTNKLCEELRLSIVRLVHWTSLDKQTALSGIKFYDFQRFLERFTDRVYLQCLLQGNISKAAAIENARNCLKIINNKPLMANTVPRLRFHELPRGERCCRIKNIDANTDIGSVINYYQIGETTSHRLSVMIDLLIMLMTDSKFQDLRAREGIDVEFIANKLIRGLSGYSLTAVGKDCLIKISHPLLGCLKTSKDEGIDGIEANIENYRKDWNLTVKSLLEKELLGIKKIFLAAKKQPDPSLRCEVLRNWNEIISGDCVFNRREQEIAAVNALDAQDMRKWLAHLTTDASKLRKLSVQVCCAGDIENRKITRTEQNGKDSKTECKNYDQHGITYLTDLSKETEKRGDHYYINDIADFKIHLKILPVTEKVGGTGKMAIPPPSKVTSEATATKVRKSDEENLPF